jgi:hypothetical protein
MTHNPDHYRENNMRGSATLARLAVGSLLAGGLALSGAAGVAFADTAASQPTMGASMNAADDCLAEYREGTREGHKAGYDFGHTKGYNEGYKKAYGEGYEPKPEPEANKLQREGLLEPGPCQKDYEEAFAAAYDKGEQKGYQVGYKKGWSEGHAKAKQDSREDSEKKPEGAPQN